VIGVGLCWLAAPSIASAELYKGRTSQDRRAVVRAERQGPPATVKIRWQAPCARPRFIFRSETGFRRPFDSVSGDSIEDTGTYRERLSGTRATISVRLVARRTAKGKWRGTFRARVVVRRNGRVIDRCRMARATRWGASL